MSSSLTILLKRIQGLIRKYQHFAPTTLAPLVDQIMHRKIVKFALVHALEKWHQNHTISWEFMFWNKQIKLNDIIKILEDERVSFYYHKENFLLWHLF